MKELEIKVKALVVTDSLSFYFFPNFFSANWKTERVILLLEMSSSHTRKIVEGKLDELLNIKREIQERLGVGIGGNIIFGFNWRDENSYKEGSIKIEPLQNKAIGLFREISSILCDDKIFRVIP